MRLQQLHYYNLNYCTVKPLITNTSKLNDYMELFKTVPAYSWLFIYFHKY